MVLTVFAGEKRLAAQHLRENTTNTPYVDGFGVLLEGQHDLWSTIPSRGDIFGHETRIVIGGSGRSSETKITHFEITVGVQKQIGWFQISVEDVCRMHGLQSSESLVNEVLTVVVGEILCSDDTMHIGFHQFLQSAN